MLFGENRQFGHMCNTKFPKSTTGTTILVIHTESSVASLCLCVCVCGENVGLNRLRRSYLAQSSSRPYLGQVWRSRSLVIVHGYMTKNVPYRLCGCTLRRDVLPLW